MHELAIADNIITTVRQAALTRDMRSISRIGVRIGSLSSVDPESLKFGFDVLKVDQGLDNCELAIEFVGTQAKCRNCQTEFVVEDLVFICPACESSQSELISGQELEITYFEGE